MKHVALCGGPQVPRGAATTPQAHATQQQQDDTAHQMSPLGLVGPGSFFLSTPPRCASTRTCISPPRTQSLQRTAPGQAEDTPLGCTHNTPRCRYCLGRPTPSQMPPRVSLIALGRIALEPVDEPGLGRAEGEPVAPGLLQRDEELPTAVHRPLVEVVSALELGLERELAA